MNRTITFFLIAWVVAGVALFATQTSKRYYLSDDKIRIEERVTDSLSASILTLEELIDTCPNFYPHEVTQRFDNRRFHMISVSPDDKHIAFVTGEPDQWLGVIDTEARTYKFILFGKDTRFLDALWSPDSRFLAYAFHGPDRRIVVHMIEPPYPGEVKPHPMNGWQYNAMNREGIRMIGWEYTKDSTFSFNLIDFEGKLLEKFKLPLHRPIPPSADTAKSTTKGK